MEPNPLPCLVGGRERPSEQASWWPTFVFGFRKPAKRFQIFSVMTSKANTRPCCIAPLGNPESFRARTTFVWWLVPSCALLVGFHFLKCSNPSTVLGRPLVKSVTPPNQSTPLLPPLHFFARLARSFATPPHRGKPQKITHCDSGRDRSISVTPSRSESIQPLRLDSRGLSTPSDRAGRPSGLTRAKEDLVSSIALLASTRVCTHQKIQPPLALIIIHLDTIHTEEAAASRRKRHRSPSAPSAAPAAGGTQGERKQQPFLQHRPLLGGGIGGTKQDECASERRGSSNHVRSRAQIRDRDPAGECVSVAACVMDERAATRATGAVHLC